MEFSMRAVAFLDILGFKQLIIDAENKVEELERLQSLINLVDHHILNAGKKLNKSVPDDVKPKYIFISDSIIISAPLEYQNSNGANYDGLAIVALTCIHITQELLAIGYLIRGGISVGKAYHTNGNIFGSGYIGAYETETTAKHPRIMLDDKAIHWLKKSDKYGLFVKYERDVVVDIFNTYYLECSAEKKFHEDHFHNYRKHITENLKKYSLWSSPRSKWEWMAGFFNAALYHHGVSIDPFDFLPLSHNSWERIEAVPEDGCILKRFF